MEQPYFFSVIYASNIEMCYAGHVYGGPGYMFDASGIYVAHMHVHLPYICPCKIYHICVIWWAHLFLAQPNTLFYK